MKAEVTNTPFLKRTDVQQNCSNKDQLDPRNHLLVERRTMSTPLRIRSIIKAIVQDTYGSPDVLELKDIDKPPVGDHDVLVRVDAAGVNMGVWHLMTGQVPEAIRYLEEGHA